MSRRNCQKNFNKKKALSVAMAIINGIQVNAPLALPLAAAVQDRGQYSPTVAARMDDEPASLLERGGQAVDSLFFSTAYAYTSNVGGTTSVSGETVSSGGTQLVYSGGSTTDTTVSSGGEQKVYSGGSTTDTTVSSGGTQKVYLGGSATSTMVSSGGMQLVSTGGSATSTTVSSGGEQEVVWGGVATSTTVSSGGTQYVAVGGSATEVQQIRRSAAARRLYIWVE
ncbi:MAG: putative autotransporter [Firmicutes bacterium]|nr:putative autotransporter [Bacillota bacterium]